MCVLALLGCVLCPAAARGGPVILSAERSVRNNHASDRNLEPVISTTALEEFDATIDVQTEFDGSPDPALGGWDSTITSIARIGQSSMVGASGNTLGMLDVGFARVRMFDTHSTNPITNLHEVESLIDVSFRLDRPGDFQVSVRSDAAGSSYLLALDGPGGRVFEFIDEIDEDAPDQDNAQGTLPPGVYRLRQIASARTEFGEASGSWGFGFNVVEQANPIPLPPAALPGLALMGAGAVARTKRRSAKS
jgi:hypothetical protein